MKFTCDKCNKKYGIDNKKLENYGSSFKIKCQSCNHIIVVTNPYSKKKPILSSKEWYLFINNEQLGPMSIDEIKDYINKGELIFSTLVWKAGMDDWKQAQTVEDLKHLIKLPIRTSERRKNQSKKLNMLYDEFESKNTNNSIDDSAFDEDEKTLTKDEFDKKSEGLDSIKKHSNSKNDDEVFSEEEEKESASVTSDDFFDKNYEEKKEDKDSKLLRSLTGNSSMGNTGIFVMYNQKRKQERMVFFILLAAVLVIGISTIIYFKNKDPKIKIVKGDTKIVKVKGDTKIIEKIKYIEVKGSDGKVRRVKSNKNEAINEVKVSKKIKTGDIDLYSNKGRNLSTSNNSKKLAIKSKSANVGATGDYGKDVAKVVSDSKRGVFWCYRKELKSNPDLIAKVYFKLNISASGRVNTISSNFKPSKYNGGNMGNCMENKIKLWKFPSNPEGQAIDFKFSIALKAN